MSIVLSFFCTFVEVKNLRKILLPFSLLYGVIIDLRNWVFNIGIIKSASFDTPTIIVGNLNVGGTGKSPQIEYLIRLLQKKYRVAILSRGYKRKSKGFQLANQNSSAEEIGDEPLQFYRKFSDNIVAVDSDRTRGIRELERLINPPDVILLDDAFQHRKVKGGFNILLTQWKDLYIDDYILPAGNLREKRKGAKRAEIIIVTKCPYDLSKKEQNNIELKLSLKNNQTIYFTGIEYNDFAIGAINNISIEKLNKYKVLLVTGIANPKPLIQFLVDKNISYEHLKFPDHHNYTLLDKKRIYSNLESMDSDKKIILTTEKDYVRGFSISQNQIYYLPIQTKLLNNEEEFNNQILSYVRSNTRNS